MNLAEQLRSARKKKGLTQMQIANRTGLSLAAISNLERGDNDNPSTETLVKLVAELGGSYTFEERGRTVVVADVTSMNKLVGSLADLKKKR